MICIIFYFFFSSRRRHTRCGRDWSSDVCSSDLNLRSHSLLDPSDAEQTWLSRNLQRIASDFRAHGLQPQAQPAALETGVTGDEYTPPSPKVGSTHQFLHGGVPDCHSSSSRILSRSVSIGCQKPVCGKAASEPSCASRSSGPASQTLWSPSI